MDQPTLTVNGYDRGEDEVWTDLKLADNTAVIVVDVSGFLTTKQLERVQPLTETVELWLRLEFIRKDLIATHVKSIPLLNNFCHQFTE